MLKALWKFIWLLVYNVLERVVKFIYLLLPLGFHMFVLQMREKVDPVTTLATFVSPDSRWSMVYDGLVLVNTNPGAIRKKAQNFKKWLLNNYVYIVLTILTILGIIGVSVFIILHYSYLK